MQYKVYSVVGFMKSGREIGREFTTLAKANEYAKTLMGRPSTTIVDVFGWNGEECTLIDSDCKDSVIDSFATNFLESENMATYTVVGRDEEGYDVAGGSEWDTLLEAVHHARALCKEKEAIQAGLCKVLVLNERDECIADYFVVPK